MPGHIFFEPLQSFRMKLIPVQQRTELLSVVVFYPDNDSLNRIDFAF